MTVGITNRKSEMVTTTTTTIKTETTNSNQEMDVYFLLDRSGSMYNCWDSTIDSINDYVTELKSDNTKANISVYAFDSEEPLKKAIDKVKIDSWMNLKDLGIQPRGMTPLNDAIGKLFQEIKLSNPNKATIIILTDGQENHSKEFKNEDVKKIMDEFKNKNYNVVFLGADIDSFSQASNYGMTRDAVLDFSKTNVKSTMKSVASATNFYSQNNATRAFSSSERAEAVKK